VHPDACLDEWERAYELPLGRAEALDFFSTADYVLTPAHEQALATFFDLCARAGLIAAPPPLKWFGGKS
jgi:predicted solute-binding protein